MDKSINISDLDFHSRITRKYQKGKINPYDFPLMIFFRNTGKLLYQKINLNILLKFNTTKKITAQYILKSAEGIKNLLEWFRIERYVPKQNKVSLDFRSKDIPIFISFAFEKINSSLNRIIYPLFLNSEKSYFKSPFQTFNQDQQIDPNRKSGHLQKEEILSDIKLINNNKILNNYAIKSNNNITNNTKITNENLLNKDTYISSLHDSISWDYKFVFHAESPVILKHVNLLLTNSKLSNSNLSNSNYYPEVLNYLKNSTLNLSNTNFSNYIQIINHGLHPGFEPAILPHVNLMLNNMPIQGDSLTSNKYFNFSKLVDKYHVILPHVNLLLNGMSIQGDSLTSNKYFKFSKSDKNYQVIQSHVNLLSGNNILAKTINLSDVLNDTEKVYKNRSNTYVSNHFQINGIYPGFEPVILSNVNLLLKTISANNIVSYAQEFSTGHISGHEVDHSYPYADLMVQEAAVDKDNRFINVQFSNDSIRNIQFRNSLYQKNMPEMILSHSKSFPINIKHVQEKDSVRTLSVIMPSIIEPALKDDIRGQTSVNMEHLIRPDKSTEASTETHDLQFKTNRNIEEEIENVKRIAYEAKQTVIESVKNIQTSHEDEMKRKININQLSDQVYRLLDRKITIEKERRGYI